MLWTKKGTDVQIEWNDEMTTVRGALAAGHTPEDKELALKIASGSYIPESQGEKLTAGTGDEGDGEVGSERWHQIQLANCKSKAKVVEYAMQVNPEIDLDLRLGIAKLRAAALEAIVGE